MALKLKQHTPNYKGLDGDYYLDRNSPFVIICTNRNTGKTTNLLGAIAARRKGFLLLTRYKAEQEYAQSKLLDACNYYGVELEWNKKEQAFKNEAGDSIGFIGALTGANDIKNQAEKFHDVEYIVFDEFLPVDKRYIKETTSPGFELEALRWIIGSIRKGRDGNIHRPIKIIMLSNLVDAVNPYFTGIRDSKGASLITHLARSIHAGQTNFTLEDPAVYLTVHIDESFEATDSLGEFVSGYTDEGLARGFLQDFSSRVKKKDASIAKQLKSPILSLGFADAYIIRTDIKVRLGDYIVSSTQQVIYWVATKPKQPDPLIKIQSAPLLELNSYYENIVVKAEVRDFMHKLNLQFKSTL